MWVNQPVARVKKVNVMKLEAENRKLRLSLLSITAMMRNMNNNHSHRLDHTECRLYDELSKLMLMIIIFIAYTVMAMTFKTD